MKRKPILTAVACAMVFFMSCKNEGTSTGLPIPNDASMVFHVNTSSLTSKLSWEEIKATSWFRESAEKEKDSLTIAIMQNPEASGVDVKSDLVFFMKQHGKGGYGVFQARLKDASAFENMLKKQQPDETVQTDGDLKYMETDDNQLVCWTGKSFIAMSDMPMMRGMAGAFGQGSGTKAEPFTKDSLLKFSRQLFSLKSSQHLDQDKRFNDLLKESGDLHVWMNSEKFSSSIGGGMMSMMKMSDLLKGNVSAFTLNFDNGKITAKTKQYFGEALRKMMENYKADDISENMIDRIPSQNVAAAFATNFDPAFLKDFLTGTGFDGMVNSFLAEINFTLDELLSVTRGNFLMAVSDFGVKEGEVAKPAYYQDGMPYGNVNKKTDMKILFATSVKNRQSFEKLLGVVEQRMGRMPGGVEYKMNDEWFAASNSPETVDNFLKGGNNNVPFADKISGHPMGMYIDAQKFIRGAGKTLENSADSAEYNANLAMWQDVIGTGGEYKDGVVTFDIVVNMVDKNTNSLKQLNAYGEKMAAAKKLRPVSPWDDMQDYPMTDTTEVYTPPVIRGQ